MTNKEATIFLFGTEKTKTLKIVYAYKRFKTWYIGEIRKIIIPGTKLKTDLELKEEIYNEELTYDIKILEKTFIN